MKKTFTEPSVEKIVLASEEIMNANLGTSTDIFPDPNS